MAESDPMDQGPTAHCSSGLLVPEVVESSLATALSCETPEQKHEE